jgi:3-oxoacyl-[acyl-carrier protein] reductase
MKFSGKNVLVTGSSRGIGAEIVRTLAEYGLKVWINYRNSFEEADKLHSELQEKGLKSAVIGFDASSETDFISGIKTVIDADGELNYLVNNAGITKDKLAIRMKLEDFESVIKANLTSAFIGSREALKVMSKKRFGSVVNIASIVGEGGNAGQTNYSASKGGMITMTKSFAQEGAVRGVRFNSVTPGFIETDMTSSLKDDIKNNYISQIPLKRFGSTKEVAEVVSFLLSDSSSYITGETLKVNGGLYM